MSFNIWLESKKNIELPKRVSQEESILAFQNLSSTELKQLGFCQKKIGLNLESIWFLKV